MAFWLGPKGGKWLCLTPFINTESRKVKKKQFFADFGAFWSPLVPLLAFWLGPNGGKWLCLTPYINTHSILVLFCMFRPTGASER